MGLIITTPKLTSGVTTYGVFLRKRSDDTIWRPGTGWVASCTNAQAFVALTELTAQFAGVYRVEVTGLGDAGWIDAMTVNSADTYNQVSGTGIGEAYIAGGEEVALNSIEDILTTDGVKVMDIDGLTYESAVEAIMAALLNISEVSGNEVTFMKRDGVTPKLVVTLGATNGTREGSDIDP